jgi:uncharacterized C2H2 Zn-finger protein
LEDCKHVLEATGLEQWMAQNDGEIKLKECPRCKVHISKTQRYMNAVKKVYYDVRRVKSRVFGNMNEIEASRDDLKRKLLKVEDFLALIMKGNVTNHNYIMTLGCLKYLMLVSSSNIHTVISYGNTLEEPFAYGGDRNVSYET